MQLTVVILLVLCALPAFLTTPSSLLATAQATPTLMPTMPPPAPDSHGIEAVPLTSGDFSTVTLQIASRRAAYILGEDIFLTTTLVNHGRGEVRYVTTHKLFRDLDLTILDASGKRVAPNIDHELLSGSVGPTSQEHDKPRIDGANVSSWGYALRAGTYQIFVTLGSVTSNRLSIRVVVPTLLRSEPIPASWSLGCKSDPGVDYRSVFPTDLKNTVSPDIGVIVFSVPFGLVSAKLTFKPDNPKIQTVEVIATSVEQPSRNSAVLRALLPPLHELTSYAISIEAPLTNCQGDYNGTLGVLRTAAKPNSPAAPVSLPRPSPTALVATPSPTATPLPTAQPATVFVPVDPSGPPQDASGIVARVSSSKRTYGVGEPIMLRVALRNTGDQPYTRPWIQPWFIIRLVIIDENGARTEAIGHESHSEQTHESINHPGAIKPGESMELGWEAKTEFPLSFWDVTLPRGKYTIQAVPEVENAYSTVDHSIRSNSLTIRVK